METKNPNAFVLKKFEKLGYDEHHLISPTETAVGGFALFWKSNVKLEVLYANANLIDTFIEYEGKSFFASFIYGDCDKKQRQLQWEHLTSMASSREAPWFATGDFNDLISNSEKVGGPERTEGSLSDLCTFFSEGDLFDLRHSRDPLSWRGQRGTHFVRCRLDRAVANSFWAEAYPTARCQYLDYASSDHKPLISFLEPDSKKRKGMFRYDRRLKDNVEAKLVIKEAWKAAGQTSVSSKISAARHAITEWNKLQHRNSRLLIEENKRELEATLTSPVNDTTLIQSVTEKLNAAYLAEEEFWKQRSRLLWLQLGDRNTGFFHATAKNRKRANAFTVIENNNGESFYKEEEIAKVITSYFEDLFTSTPARRDRAETIHHAIDPVITDVDNERLIAVPSAAEIWEETFSIHSDKAPGPDGFSAGFFQTHWDDIGADIVKEVQEYFRSGTLPSIINSTHIRLIPKGESPQKVSEYRPIALCNVYYKVFSKILTRRLQSLLDSIISENQSAFVPGRAIFENVLITHEVLHFLKNSKAEKRCSMAVKTDMTKAYDRLEWDFIALV